MDDPEVHPRARSTPPGSTAPRTLARIQDQEVKDELLAEHRSVGRARHLRRADVLRRRRDLLRQGPAARRRGGDRGAARAGLGAGTAPRQPTKLTRPFGVCTRRRKHGWSARSATTSVPSSASRALNVTASGWPISKLSKLQPPTEVVAGCTVSSQSMNLGTKSPKGLSSRHQQAPAQGAPIRRVARRVEEVRRRCRASREPPAGARAGLPSACRRTGEARAARRCGRPSCRRGSTPARGRPRAARSTRRCRARRAHCASPSPDGGRRAPGVTPVSEANSAMRRVEVAARVDEVVKAEGIAAFRSGG